MTRMLGLRGAGRVVQPLDIVHVLDVRADKGARCLHVECYEGEPESVGMPVKNIIVDAARLGSAGVVLAHNHPSGDARPSKADCLATRRLAHAAEAIDLAILDHLIFAGRNCSSMRRMGLL